MGNGKVFGIGFHKTGTTSLGRALEILGYRVCGPVHTRNSQIQKEVYDIAFNLTPHYDAFQDNPWPIIYNELDIAYPGSKFILTVRPANKWIQSVTNHFGATDTPMRQWIYGVGHPVGNEGIYLDRYQNHIRAVKSYFKYRPGDVLVLNITGGEGWQKLCPFLEKPIPSVDFPHANKGTYDYSIKGISDF